MTNLQVRNVLRILLMPLLIIALGGCSAQQFYKGVQASHVNHCYLYPYEQAQECLEEVNMPYDEYERRREEVLEENKK